MSSFPAVPSVGGSTSWKEIGKQGISPLGIWKYLLLPMDWEGSLCSHISTFWQGRQFLINLSALGCLVPGMCMWVWLFWFELCEAEEIWVKAVAMKVVLERELFVPISPLVSGSFSLSLSLSLPPPCSKRNQTHLWSLSPGGKGEPSNQTSAGLIHFWTRQIYLERQSVCLSNRDHYLLKPGSLGAFLFLRTPPLVNPMEHSGIYVSKSHKKLITSEVLGLGKCWDLITSTVLF